jgi:ribonuclease/clavin/mitogillin
MASAPTIVNVGHRSTNFWVVSTPKARLLVDLGWPGMFGALEAELKRKDIPLKEITHGLATHYHIDHAGAAQDLKNRGMKLIVTPEQVPMIEMMKKWTKPEMHYTPISITDNVVIECADSRTFLAKLGIAGEIVHTPGHSEDSVSLLLDGGEAFTGDLTLPNMIAEESEELVMHSWNTLREKGATRVFGGHGPIHAMPSS